MFDATYDLLNEPEAPSARAATSGSGWVGAFTETYQVFRQAHDFTQLRTVMLKSHVHPLRQATPEEFQAVFYKVATVEFVDRLAQLMNHPFVAMLKLAPMPRPIPRDGEAHEFYLDMMERTSLAAELVKKQTPSTVDPDFQRHLEAGARLELVTFSLAFATFNKAEWSTKTKLMLAVEGQTALSTQMMLAGASLDDVMGLETARDRRLAKVTPEQSARAREALGLDS